MQFDVLIKNGCVIDGAGNPWFKADIGINAGRIAAIEQSLTEEGGKRKASSPPAGTLGQDMALGMPSQRRFVWKELCRNNQDKKREGPIRRGFDLLIEENAMGSIMGEDKLQTDIDYALNHPTSMVGSDGSALAPYGVLGRGKVNPRSYGTFPNVLARYVRERKVITLETAIRKMTSFPAQRFGLKDRGLLRPGMWTDILVFDQNRILDTATDSPYQYPEGILHVLVNGRLVIEQGNHTGALPGKILRKRS